MTDRSLEATPDRGDAGMELVVPCPVLVGRARELETMTSALDTAVTGEGRVLFVTGEAGIGKSRLVHELVTVARQRGARILRGRAVPGSYGAAFRPLTEALAPVAGDLAADPSIDPWLPALSAIVPTVAAPSAADATVPVRGEAIVRALRSLCDPSGGVLVLEDLHWADAESVAIVEHLTDHLARAPVLCVATVRPEEPGPGSELVRRIAARRSAPVLELSRLNEAQVAAMVHSCTGGALSIGIERVAALADGVPFLVEEMLASPGLPESFAEGVRARLGELPADDQRVLLVAAAFGRHFDWRLLGAVAEIEERRVVDALDRGVATQLLAVEGDGFRFRHALTAEAVFQSAIPPRREALARRALGAFDAAHPQPPNELREVAARLAELTGDRDRAGALHLASGEDALRHGALRTAVAALERAVDLLDGDPRTTAEERLVDVLALAGRVDEALARGTRLVGRLSASRSAAIHLRLAGASATAARWNIVDQQLKAARTLVADAATAAIRAELAAREAELALGTDDVERAEQQAGEALRVARQEGLHEIECEALQLLGRCARRASLNDAERWFREALATAETHGLTLWQLKAQHEVGTIALLERSAVDELLAAQRLAEATGAMATAAVLDIEIAAGHAARDDTDGLVRHAERAVGRATELGLGLIAAYAWMHLSAAARLRGDAEAGEAAAASARAAAPGNRDIEGLVVGAELLAALFRDEMERAPALAERLTDVLRDSGTAPPAHHRAAWPVLLALAGDARAPEAIDEIERSGAAVNRGARGWLALARAIVAGHDDPQRAAAIAREADALLEYMPMWRAVARRIAAEAAARDGWSIPDGWLAEAESWARSLGYDAVADSCRRLRGAATDEVPAAWTGWGISRRESDVLRLVVEGRSNREIAEQLFLSVRTVEKHVESLLRKTSTKTRTQLAHVASAP